MRKYIYITDCVAYMCFRSEFYPSSQLMEYYLQLMLQAYWNHVILIRGQYACQVWWVQVLIHYGLFICVSICRGFSRKLHKLVSEHRKHHHVGESTSLLFKGKRDKFEPKNWRQLSEKELKNLHPVQRSKFMMVLYISSALSVLYK